MFEASGALGVFDQAIQLIRPAGTIVAGGFNPTPDPVSHGFAVLKEIRVQYAASYFMDDLRTLADVFSKGATPLRKLITKRITLDQFPAAFENHRKNSIDCKVMLSPWN